MPGCSATSRHFWRPGSRSPADRASGGDSLGGLTAVSPPRESPPDARSAGERLPGLQKCLEVAEHPGMPASGALVLEGAAQDQRKLRCAFEFMREGEGAHAVRALFDLGVALLE